jgi:hypothetical protein
VIKVAALTAIRVRSLARWASSIINLDEEGVAPMSK